VSTAMEMAVNKEKTAAADVVKVTAAMRSVRSRRDAATGRLAKAEQQPSTGAAGEKAIRDFSQKVVKRFETLKDKAAKPKGQTKYLEERITALEEALHSAHSVADDAIKKEISSSEAKLNKLKSKQTLLRQNYTAAKKKKDNHHMIKLGTEEKDNSVHEKRLASHIKELRSKLEATKVKIPQPPPKPKKKSAASDKIQEKIKQMRAAVDAAKAAGAQRAKLLEAEDKAQKEEKAKLKSANKAKSELAKSLKQESEKQHKVHQKAEKKVKKQMKKQLDENKKGQAGVMTKIKKAGNTIGKLHASAIAVARGRTYPSNL